MRLKIKDIFIVPIYALLFFMVYTIMFFGFTHWDYGDAIRNVASGRNLFAISLCGFFVLFSMIRLFHFIMCKCSNRIKNTVLILWAIIIFAFQIYVCIYYKVHLGWDNTNTLASAIGILDKTYGMFLTEYFEIYPNQKCFLLVTAFFVKMLKLFGASNAVIPIILSIISVVCVDGAVYFIYRTIKKIRGEKTANYIFLWMLLNPGLILWSFYYYTTNLSLLLVSIVVYWLVAWHGAKKCWWHYFMLGAVISFGIQFRATMVIVLIAALISYVLFYKKNFLKFLTGFVCGILMMQIVIYALLSALLPPLNEENAFPIEHWIMMSAQGVGEYNDADVFFTASYENTDARKQAAVEEYKRRVTELGWKGFLELSERKICHTFSYGTHEYNPSFQRYDGLYDYLWGSKNFYMVCYQQVYANTLWIFVLLTIISQIKKRDFMFFPLLILLGGIMFYALWETDPYYSVGFITVLYVCVTDGVCVATDMTDRLWKMKVGKLFLLVALSGSIMIAVVKISHVAKPVNANDNIPVVSQQKTNNVLYFRGDNVICQTFVANRTFDTISFWLTKEKRKEDSTGKYIISLKKENGDVVFSEILLNQDVYRTIEYLKNFPPVFVEGEEKFVLEISVSEDDADNRMGVCYYDLPIETYLDGELLFDDEKLQGDMMFNVYESKK